MTPRVAARVAVGVLRRPSLWMVALQQWRRTTPTGWWRRRPFLPVPSRDYLHFRLVTQYGREDAPIAAGDVMDYLAWCKQQARAA
ncbi:MAG: hypothetical protein KGR47_13790 [Acidobacteria bacterium]|nr:hypothetical protein [Acidobacteriota bacterium]